MRARQTVIDPTRYGAKHLTAEDGLGGDEPTSSLGTASQWVYEDSSKRWLKMLDDGTVLEADESLAKREAQKSRVTSKAEAVPATSKTKISTKSIPADVALPASSPPPNSPPKATLSKKEKKAAASATAASALVATTTPTVPTRLISEPLSKTNEAPKVDDVGAALAEEKAKNLAIMRGLLQRGWEVDLSDVEDADSGEGVVMRRDASDDADDVHMAVPDDIEIGSQAGGEDDEEMMVDNGLAATSSETLKSGTDEEDESSEDEDEPMVTVEKTTIIEAAPEPKPKEKTDGPKSLKDMFAPREEEGLSLKLSSSLVQ